MSRELGLPAGENPRASILIAAFNPPTFGACVRSLAEHLPIDASCEVIAVLNGPSEPLLAAAGEVEGLRILDPLANLGFAAGANLARSAASGEYLVLLQDDAQIEPGWLEALLAAADANAEAGAVGGMVLEPDGDRVQAAGLVLWSDGSHAEVGGGGRPETPARAGVRAVDYCSSSSLLVGAETWDAIGGLDDSFFPAGHVDSDLAMRIRRHGQAVLVQPEARSRHRRGASSTKPYKRFIAVRNGLLFRERWGGELARAHEPPPSGTEDADAAIERALRRAEERRGGATAPAGVARGEGPEQPDDDRARLERALRFTKRDLELRLAYEAELEAALAQFELAAEGGRAENERLQAEVDSLHERLARSEAALTSITEGGWWRLRERLLPLIRLLRRRRTR